MKDNRQRLWLGMALIIFLYGSFLTYFCVAKPNEPNNVIIEQGKTVGPEFYLSEISDFYEIVIIILSTAIFVILGLVFFYSMRISEDQAKEIVIEAIEKKSFDNRLKKMIDERFIDLKNKGDIADICTELENIGERIDFIENVITKRSYKSETDNSLDDKS